ncbi:MAG: hypothetical protein LH603_21060 [Pseudonocardia sp.]|nr:hypothetical protein [Pseudonocardia sp.]
MQLCAPEAQGPTTRRRHPPGVRLHIAEGYLPPLHAVARTVVAAPFVVHGARAVVRQVREEPETKLLLGAAGATPLADTLPRLERLGVPPAVTEIAALMYRLLFLLLDTVTAVRDAQARRLGFRTWRCTYRSVAGHRPRPRWADEVADAAPRTAAELHALLEDEPVATVSHPTSNGSGSEGAAIL